METLYNPFHSFALRHTCKICNLYNFCSSGGHFPQITFDEAERASNTSRYMDYSRPLAIVGQAIAHHHGKVGQQIWRDLHALVGLHSNNCGFITNYGKEGPPYFRQDLGISPQMQDLGNLLLLQLQSFIMQDIAQEGKLVDIKLRVNIKVANEVFRMVLGHRFTGSIGGANEEADAEGREFKDVIDELQQLKGLFMLGDFVPWLRHFDIGGIEKRMKSVQAHLDTFLSKVVEEHEAKWQEGPIAEADKDMVDVLLRSTHEQDHLQESLKLDVETIKATAMSMIAAGVDTSSVTVEWAMAELMRNPRVMETLTYELNIVVGKCRMLEEADIPKLKYLQAVVKEVFRLHPPAPMLIPHESTEDCELAGYFIPAETRLLVHAYAIGRRAEEWENPQQFEPERFMRRPDMDVKGQDYGLLPFGSGRRACPAINLGTMSMQWTIAVLVHAFEWSLPAGERAEDVDMSEEFGITLPRAKTLLLRARPRLEALRVYGAA